MHDLLDVRVLHLDRHVLAGVQPRLVHLTDRGRRHRLGREFREQRLGVAPPELLLQSIADVGIGTRRHLILQGLELVAKGVGEEVGHDADELPDLDEQPPQLDDGRLDAQGIAAMLLPGQPRDRVVAAKTASDGQPQVGQRDPRDDQVHGEEA